MNKTLEDTHETIEIKESIEETRQKDYELVDTNRQEYEYVPSEEAVMFHKNLEIMKQNHPEIANDIIAPHWGVQTEFFLCKAQIAVYGGALGGGKSFCSLAYALSFIHLPYFRAGIYRREFGLITQPGGLLDESRDLYTPRGGKLDEQTYKWSFGSRIKGAKIDFRHMQHEKNVDDQKGSQYQLVFIDEGDSFSERMIWGSWERCRTTKCPMTPRLRITTNPNPHSFLRKLIDWWIDDNGFAIRERSGVIRWVTRNMQTGELIWGDTKAEVQKEIDKLWAGYDRDRIPEPISFTFIHADLSDNKSISKEYLNQLGMIDPVSYKRKVEGNWNIVESAGEMFHPSWVEIVDEHQIPDDLEKVRGYDIAASEPSKRRKNPDGTSSTLIGKDGDGNYYILDNEFYKLEPHEVYERMKEAAERDGKDVPISVPQDPGAGGKIAVATFKEVLEGYDVYESVESGSKTNRFRKFSAEAYRGFNLESKQKMRILRGTWNDRWLNRLHGFPDPRDCDDDEVDATSRAFNYLYEDESFDWTKLGEIF